jgi:superfamily I DNA/RNA helicase
MKSIKKQIVTNESMHPVAVLIDYQDWQVIEKILEAYQQENTATELADFADVIQLTVDPMEYQQQIREEWT